VKEKRKVIALGFFDGVHRGHGALLSRVLHRAEELDAIPAAVTFDAHPSALLEGHSVPLINTLEDRAGLMRRYYGIQDVEVAHFDQNMMHQPWRDFITEYLVKEQNACHVVCGHDFHFGYRGEGNPQRMEETCKELGLGCDIIGRVELEGITVSSTYIRTLIAQGEMERAVEYLGHPQVLTGTVVHGKQLGRTIGIPTANLDLPDGLVKPAFGVYASKVVLENGEEHLAVTNVGIRPTIHDGDRVTVEPWILDYSGDLYGQQLRLELYHFLRSERRFNGLEELKAEICRNAEETRQYFM
jgi:riboflavin kinase/FMN adenylyltransferase